MTSETHARTLSSPDELSVYVVRQLMRQEAPSLLWITMHDIDIAHAGAYSLYIEGIRRTDRFARKSGKRSRASPSMREKPRFSYCRISGVTPMKIRAATGFSITALAMRLRARHG